tara:strand:+ start:103 stop:2118 length:2016 start_codon:yes stop_codon:yes gene_type:complete
MKYRAEIDGLRAIAVLSVIFYHSQFNFFSYKILGGGYLGVDIFFVISGYLITSIIYQEILLTNNFNILNFYERRIRRILPALFGILIFSLIVGKILLFPSPLHELVKSIISSIFFYSNYFFYFTGLEYGGIEAAFKPLLHTWSLAVEEQFYILFPIFFLIVFRFNKKCLLIFLSLLFFLSLSSILILNNLNSFHFYSLSSRMWEILAGSVLAYIKLNKKIKTDKLKNIFSYIGLGLIIFCLIFAEYKSNEFNYSIIYPLLVVFGTSLIILYINEKSLIYKILINKFLVFVGLISYSLYLWHYPIFAFSKIIDFTHGNIIYKIFLFLFLFLISTISYFLIEKPFRNKNFINFKTIIKFFILILILLLLPSIIIISSLKKFDPELIKYFDKSDLKISNYSINSKILNISDINSFLDNNNYNRERKHLINLNHNLFKYNNKKNILFMGNSYAEDLFLVSFMSPTIKEKYNMSYITLDYRNKNCLENLSKNILKCKSLIDQKIDLQNFVNSDLIVINFLPFSEIKEYYDVLNKLIILNKEKKKKIILISLRDTFRFENKKYGFDKLDQFIYESNRAPNKLELKALEKLYWAKRDRSKNKINMVLKMMAKEHNIEFFDITKGLCNESTMSCKIMTNSKQKIYYDGVSHFSVNGAYYISNNILGAKLERLYDKILNN